MARTASGGNELNIVSPELRNSKDRQRGGINDYRPGSNNANQVWIPPDDIMTRNPPSHVKKALRAEIGFGCPVPGCGRPYLEWHHFDPPWHERHHHDAEGMIALCREHHIQADNGAFTKEQLHRFKRDGNKNWHQVSGNFSWLRNNLLVVLGGNFFYETLVILKLFAKPIIWFTRDANNYLLLNLYMLTTSGKQRAYIINNVWFNVGDEEDIECPPSAKRLKVSYPNGDLVSIEFFEIKAMAEFNKRYPGVKANGWPIVLPITAVEVTNIVANSNLIFSARKTKIGQSHMKNCFAAYCGAGLSIK